MIDIHSHILFNLDDGARDIEEAKRMLIMAAEHGTEEIVATSHYIPDTYPYTKEAYEHRIHVLRQWVKEENLNLKILEGNELFLSREGVIGLLDKECRTINNTKYVLTEISDFMSLSKAEALLELLTQNGYIPVIAHLERLRWVSEDFDAILGWQEKGYLFQINNESIINRKHSENHKNAIKLIKYGCVHFVASDGHRSDRRRPILDLGYRYISDRYGEAFAKQVFKDNQMAMLQNKNVENTVVIKKKPWFRFFI